MPGELDDDEYGRQQRRIADQLQQAHPSWMVLFGEYSRMFWAFPLFGPGNVYFADRDPHELDRRMTEAEPGDPDTRAAR